MRAKQSSGFKWFVENQQTKREEKKMLPKNRSIRQTNRVDSIAYTINILTRLIVQWFCFFSSRPFAISWNSDYLTNYYRITKKLLFLFQYLPIHFCCACEIRWNVYTCFKSGKKIQFRDLTNLYAIPGCDYSIWNEVENFDKNQFFFNCFFHSSTRLNSAYGIQ